MIFTVSCEEESTFSIGDVSPVNDLYTPENESFFDLEAANSVIFEWAASATSDNGIVQYEVYFDTESGDFSEPIYKIASDGNGLQRTLTLSFANLNKVAGLAGIGRGATGKLKWTVQRIGCNHRRDNKNGRGPTTGRFSCTK